MLMIRRLRILLKNVMGCFEILGLPLEEGGRVPCIQSQVIVTDIVGALLKEA
jgi:hypothetical protein